MRKFRQKKLSSRKIHQKDEDKKICLKWFKQNATPRKTQIVFQLVADKVSVWRRAHVQCEGRGKRDTCVRGSAAHAVAATAKTVDACQ